jgi:flagellar hook-basal body protein
MLQERIYFHNLYCVSLPLRLLTLALLFTLYSCDSNNNSQEENTQTKIGVNGSGYIILNNQGDRVFIRSANLVIDAYGNLVTEQGMELQGFNADLDGNIGGFLEDITLPVNDLELIRIDNQGFIYLLQDADQKPYSQIALAQFTSAYNLEDLMGGLLAQSEASGQPIIGQPSNGSFGDVIFPNGIPSTLDLSLELTTNENYFYLENNGGNFYTPSMALFLDKNGFLSDIWGNHLMGYPVSDYDLDGEQTTDFYDINPIQISNDNLAPRRTTMVNVSLNLSTSEANTDTVQYASDQYIFDPNDSGTYDYATSINIFDSLGNSHVSTMYFVNMSSRVGLQFSVWEMHVLIDGENVGDPAVGGEPTRATFILAFTKDGSLNENLSDQILISNWSPLDSDGNPNGADGPINVPDGGTLPIPYPPTSSNFEINLQGTTQLSSPFSINEIQQNGYTTGRLVSLESDSCGKITLSYSNGFDFIFRQIALISFADPESLLFNENGFYEETDASGTPDFSAACVDGFNAIKGDSLQL